MDRQGKHTARICARCVMDASDVEITFDEADVCNYCRRFDASQSKVIEYAHSEDGRSAFNSLVDKLKHRGRGHAYDCVLGVSGGVDSSYLAYLAVQNGLRVLAVHCDTGWNSELAISNIETLVRKLGIHLYTHVVDWEEMRDLQLAFFKASLANCDVPQDHALVAVQYRVAARMGVPTLLTGSNLATESVLPRSWGYNPIDRRHLLEVHKRFGKKRLHRYPLISFFDRYFYYPVVRGIRLVWLLNYVPYVKSEAKKVIQESLGWRDYGGKHHESQFTRFFQSYYLPTKFGYDKRRAHLSSLVLSGQMTRSAALSELELPPMENRQAANDKEFVAKKLGISEKELDEILAQPPRTYRDFPSNAWLFALKDRIRDHFKRKHGALAILR